MSRNGPLFPAVALAILAAVVVGPQARAAEPEALEPYLEDVIVEYGLPAVAAVAVKDGEVVAIGATGVRTLGRDERVTRDDRFHLGSNTKAMTATIAGSLVDEGLLAWDTTLGSVLGEVVEGIDPALSAVTLGALLSHTSGIPSDNAETFDVMLRAEAFDGNPADQRLEMLRLWKDEAPRVPEGSPFQYSNLGYVFAAAMMEHVTGKPWEELIATRIFAPLGLDSAGLGPQATFGRYDAPAGHALEADGTATPRLWGPAADNPLSIGPAGIAHMSIVDYARWAGWNAGVGARGPAIVSPETHATLLAPHVTMPTFENPVPGTPTGGGYGYGWGLRGYDWADRELTMHTGSNNMNLAVIVVDPEVDLAIAALTNYPGHTAEAALMEVVKRLYAAYGHGG